MTVRLDSLASAVTKIGTAADPRSSYVFCNRPVLQPLECDVLFNNYDLAYLICSIVPEEALSESWQLTSDDKDLAEALCDRMEELKALEHVLDAAVMSRVHGDCFLYTAVDDGLSEDQPLDLERVRAVRFVRKIERLKLSALTWYSDVADPKFGEVETYQVTAPRGGGQAVVHETRLIPFWGARTSEQKRRENNGWHLSVLQRIYETLRDLGIAWSSTTLLLSQSTQPKYKVKDLAAMLAAPGAEGRESLSKRIELIDYTRSALNSLILDADSEDFTYEVANLTSLPELLDRFSSRLSAASGGIPVTKLFGISPAGLNATGEGEAKNWYRLLSSYRRDHINDGVLRLRDLLLAEAGQSDADVNVTWLPLDRPSALEEAQRRGVIATADAVYLTNGVLPPEAVAEARFVQENGFDQEIHLDEIPETIEPEPEPEPELTQDAFSEADHPRAADGEFTSGGGGGSTSSHHSQSASDFIKKFARPQVKKQKKTKGESATATKTLKYVGGRIAPEAESKPKEKKTKTPKPAESHKTHTPAEHHTETVHKPKETGSAHAQVAGALDSFPNTIDRIKVSSIHDMLPHLSTTHINESLLAHAQAGKIALYNAHDAEHDRSVTAHDESKAIDAGQLNQARQPKKYHFIRKYVK